jgi:ELWxxDGT repeat protein
MKLLSFYLLFFSFISRAQQPLLVKEINDSGLAYPSEFIEFKGAMYFFALDENNEYVLHRTHGEASDVEKLESPSQRAGIGYFGSPKLLAKDENFLYLTIQNNEQYILLKTDGNKQFDYVFLPKKTSISAAENTATITKNKLWFLLNVYSGTWKNELWTSDGTAIGTYKIKGVNNAQNIFSAYNKLYFNDLDKGSFKVEGDTIMQQQKDITYIAVQKNHLYGFKKTPNLDSQLFSIDSLNQAKLLFTSTNKYGNQIHRIRQLNDTSSLCLLIKDSTLFAYEITPNSAKERVPLVSGLSFYQIPLFVQDSLIFLYLSAKIYSININTWKLKKLYESPTALWVNNINEKGFYVFKTCIGIPCNPDQLLFYKYNSASIDTLLYYYNIKNVTYFGDKIFFNYQNNLWVNNNQEKQNKLFKEFNRRNGSSYPNSFINIDKYLYFYAGNRNLASRWHVK